MTEQGTRRSSFGVIGAVAAACAVCCVGPILTFLGGLSLFGVASSFVIGGAGLLVAAVALAALLVVWRRYRCGSGGSPADPHR